MLLKRFVCDKSKLTNTSLLAAQKRGGANGGAGGRGRDGARSPAPGAEAKPGRRRRGHGRDAVFGDRTRAAHPTPPASFGSRDGRQRRNGLARLYRRHVTAGVYGESSPVG